MGANGLPGHMGSCDRAGLSFQGSELGFSPLLQPREGPPTVKVGGQAAAKEKDPWGESLGTPESPSSSCPCWHHPRHVRAFWNVVEWMSKPGLPQCRASGIPTLIMLRSDLLVIRI